MAKRKWLFGERRGFTLRPTGRPAQIREVDGITVDLARWTKKDKRREEELRRAGKGFLAVAYQVEKLVIKWPFEQPITRLGWLSLEPDDARRVVEAMYQAIVGHSWQENG